MNHAIFIIKVLDEHKPIHFIYKKYEAVEIKVQFPVSRYKDSRSELTLILWGEDRKNFLKCYKVQKYFAIEGILTFKDYKNAENEVKIITKRISPFLLV